MREIITSKDNAQVKLAAALLARKKERDKTGCFVAEGLRLCTDAVQSGVTVRTLLLTVRAGEKYPEAALLQQAAVRTVWISEELADKIGETKTPQGVFAICEKLDNARSAVTINSGGYYLLLAFLQDPGNLGAILRTADAMGMDGVFLGENCADLYSPKVLRGSMGGLFRLPISVGGDPAGDMAALQKAGVPVYAAALVPDALAAAKVDFSRGGAVLIGNEGNGLPPPLLKAATAAICLPMAQGANSLNAAMAAGMFMWEMQRSRLA